jgi:hypothetical protein
VGQGIVDRRELAVTTIIAGLKVGGKGCQRSFSRRILLHLAVEANQSLPLVLPSQRLRMASTGK